MLLDQAGATVCRNQINLWLWVPAFAGMTWRELLSLLRGNCQGELPRELPTDRVLAARCVRVFCFTPPSSHEEGTGKAGCRLAPMVRVQQKKHAAEPQVQPDQPAFPAQWFYGLYVISSVTGLSCHRHFAINAARLSASVGAPGPHDFAVRVSLRSSCAAQRPSHPALHVRDDRDTPLFGRGGTAQGKPRFLLNGKQFIFCETTGSPKSA
jgi:hypothetical protein